MAPPNPSLTVAVALAVLLLTGSAHAQSSGMTPLADGSVRVLSVGSTSPRTIAERFADLVNVRDFGAVPDFDPETGKGTDNRQAFQAALDRAASLRGGRVVVPPGRYLVAPGWKDPRANGIHIAIADSANVHFVGYGAELYQGGPGRFLGVVNSSNVTITGFKVFGYAGGATARRRENDALITVNYGSHEITITDNYLTNSLGDCVYVGGTLVSGGEVGHGSRNVTIRGNVLKERYGDGKRSWLGGTRSRTAIAVIDGAGVLIEGNDIYGRIDLEPNLNGQSLKSVRIVTNRFQIGPVAPRPDTVKQPWVDEPVLADGAGKIGAEITMVGAPGRPIIADNVFQGNTIESGFVGIAGKYVFAMIQGNHFGEGQIRLGNTAGANYTQGVVVEGNRADRNFPGERDFIRLDGKVYFSTISNNTCFADDGACVADRGAGTGDGGRNTFLGNRNASGRAAGAISLSQGMASTSVYRANSAATSAVVERSVDSHVTVSSLATAWARVDLERTGDVVDWRAYPSSAWLVAGNGRSLREVTTVPDGLRLLIVSDLTESGALTVRRGNAVRLRSNADAVLRGPASTMEFVSRGGTLVEVSRTLE
jgi:hypothetical protein